jgi:hypothetical protein
VNELVDARFLCRVEGEEARDADRDGAGDGPSTFCKVIDATAVMESVTYTSSADSEPYRHRHPRRRRVSFVATELEDHRQEQWSSNGG